MERDILVDDAEVATFILGAVNEENAEVDHVDGEADNDDMALIGVANTALETSTNKWKSVGNFKFHVAKGEEEVMKLLFLNSCNDVFLLCGIKYLF